MVVSGRDTVTMNPQQQQQQQPVTTASSNLPSGVESIIVTYDYCGRPRVLMTLNEQARRKLYVFAVILLVLSPFIIGFTTGCIVLKRYYLAYCYAAGVLVSMRAVRERNSLIFRYSLHEFFYDILLLLRLSQGKVVCV